MRPGAGMPSCLWAQFPRNERPSQLTRGGRQSKELLN